MSNPAVILLHNAGNRKGAFKRFCIEDNIGESIHLHANNSRFDFTINEFLGFSKLIEDSLNELDILCGYEVGLFDPSFLFRISDKLSDLIRIDIDTVKINDLRCMVRSEYKRDVFLEECKKVTETPAYQYLKKVNTDFIDYKQYNYLGKSNVERLENLLKSLKSNGYPFKNKYIILMGEQNIVRDGQHRLAVLAHLYGLNKTIDVMRFQFKKNEKLDFRLKNTKIKTKWYLKKIRRKLEKILF